MCGGLGHLKKQNGVTYLVNESMVSMTYAAEKRMVRPQNLSG